MLGFSSKAYCVPRGPAKSLLLFLFHLAWKSRIRLPVLIAVGFMVLDLRMQLEINIDLGLGQGVPDVGQGNEENGDILLDGSSSEESTVDEEDSDSITTDPFSYSENSEDDDNLDLDCSHVVHSADDTTPTKIENQEDQ